MQGVGVLGYSKIHRNFNYKMGMPDDTSDGSDKLKYTKLLKVKSYISIDVDFTINFDWIEQRAENTYIY